MRGRNHLVCCVLVGCATTDSSFVVPPTVVTKHHIETSSVGYGLSLDLARMDALEKCHRSASAFMDRTLNVKSELWETGQAAYIQTKITSNSIIRDLECIPLSEKSKTDLRSAQVLLTCKYDLSKIKVELATENEKEEQSSDTSSFRTDTKGRLLVTSTPPCKTVTIVGEQNTTHQCKGNPASFIFSIKDSHVIVERDGFLPQKIKLEHYLITKISVVLHPAE